MTSGEIRELILEYLQDREEVRSGEVRTWLLEKMDSIGEKFTLSTYSNAMTSLQRKGVLEPTDIKGCYKVLKKISSREKNEELPNERQMKTEMNEEKDLKEMRRKVQKCLDEAWMEIEQILDSIKPSVYAENINTYKKTIEILEVLKNMKYPMDNNSGIEDK